MSNFRDVTGKVAIVTGAARGIGKSMAETLAMEGCKVVMADLLDLVKESAKEVAEKYPSSDASAVVLDVSDEMAVKALVEGTVEKFGKLDIMANNAGMHMHTGNVWETEEKQIDRVLAVNFKGIFFGCKYAAKQMIKQKSGTIANTGSFFGKVGHAQSATYGASKAAVHTMTQSLALEIAPYNVNVNALCPGLAASEMHWGFVEADAKALGISFDEMKEKELDEIPLHRYGYGKDLAGAIMWLATPSGEYITGQLINVNGGLDFT
ncbi:MAG: SDR family NAD(P)-dependent oxidoreductase [Spirochaeta sp.]|jgi:NAD(P)-dependent dehydrogenase (short-subunit alcohol dehydrogenase family)|nr:SDR family NAD(P)-dependent oxidoreductase [Spirochaeta sp.]